MCALAAITIEELERGVMAITFDFQRRMARLRAQLESHHVQAFIIHSGENIAYLSGFSGHGATLVVSAEQALLITDYRYYLRALEETSKMEVIQRDRDRESLGQCLARVCAKHSVLGFESEHFSVGQWQHIAEHLRANTCVATVQVVERLRRVKDSQEIACIRGAAEIADAALADTLTLLESGITERELAIELDYQMQRRGSQGVSFDTILLFAERTALPHGEPGAKRLCEGDLILIDFGAVRSGYRSDMTRTYVLGEPTSEQQALFDTVDKAQQAALQQVCAGICCHELNHAAQQVLASSPYHRYAGEGLGHGVGLTLHELPFIKANAPYQLESGNVITIEPGIYIPNYGGVRLEEDIVVTETGYQRLTLAPQQFALRSEHGDY
ncbi:putative peptidase (plasmid) [Pseudoalteromonas sp. THAF3]|nr:putative peptidase [Pseudoalteromonas sp. THAF3]